MPSGWRSVVVERFDDAIPGQYRRRDLGEVDVISRLSPDQPDPTQQQLDEIAAVHARYGGYATCRVVALFWFGPVVLTPEQQRALAGLP